MQQKSTIKLPIGCRRRNLAPFQPATVEPHPKPVLSIGVLAIEVCESERVTPHVDSATGGGLPSWRIGEAREKRSSTLTLTLSRN